MNKEQKNIISKTRKKFGKTLEKFSMISENDHIAIGLSGGKDSLALLDLFAFKQKQLSFNFQLSAIHIRSSSIPYESDLQYLQNFCDERNIPLIIKNIEIDFTTDTRKTPCFLCSWNRRKALFNTAEENSITKIALGHHMNDSVETLLMNMIFNGNISAIPASLDMFSGKFKLIRPMIELTEAEIEVFSQLNNYTTQLKVCPYGDKSKRQTIKNLLNEITNIYPHGLQSINTSMSNIFEEYLNQLHKNKE